MFSGQKGLKWGVEILKWNIDIHSPPQPSDGNSFLENGVPIVFVFQDLTTRDHTVNQSSLQLPGPRHPELLHATSIQLPATLPQPLRLVTPTEATLTMAAIRRLAVTPTEAIRRLAVTPTEAILTMEAIRLMVADHHTEEILLTQGATTPEVLHMAVAHLTVETPLTAGALTEEPETHMEVIRHTLVALPVVLEEQAGREALWIVS